MRVFSADVNPAAASPYYQAASTKFGREGGGFHASFPKQMDSTVLPINPNVPGQLGRSEISVSSQEMSLGEQASAVCMPLDGS